MALICIKSSYVVIIDQIKSGKYLVSYILFMTKVRRVNYQDIGID